MAPPELRLRIRDVFAIGDFLTFEALDLRISSILFKRCGLYSVLFY